MSDIVFKKAGDNIEAGFDCIYVSNKKTFLSTRAIIKPHEKKVWTDCGDPYLDYAISFEDFIAIADKIKEIERSNHE